MPQLYVYTFMWAGKMVHIYAESEKVAREKYKRLYAADAGDLIRRERW